MNDYSENPDVIPAKAGIQSVNISFKDKFKDWAPAFAGATDVDTVLRNSTELFAREGFESPDIEARALLAGLLQCSRSAVLLHRDDIVDAEIRARFNEWVERRLRREPASYIVGNVNFMGFEFDVTPATLVPRPETELLVEDALMEIRDRGLRAPRILDMGTGSGCIAISLARLLPQAQLIASDKDEKALEVAAKNARKNDVNVSFFQSDLFTELASIREGGFDMILSNPPYIASPEFSRLEPELSYEPRHALDGGLDGLDLIRDLVREAPSFLRPNGLLALEIGHDQGERVQDLLAANHFENVLILKDYSGFDRIAKGTKRGPV